MRALPPILLLTACTAGAPSDDTDTRDTDAAGPPALDLLLVDNGWSKVVRLDQVGEDQGWEASVPGGARDVTVVGDRALVSHGEGAVWLDVATGATLTTVDGFSDVQSAQPLADDHLLLGAQDGDDVVLIEVDADGVEVSRVTVPDRSELRLVRRLADGHTLFTAGVPGFVVEVDAAGAEVWSTPIPGKGYVAERTADGHTRVTTGSDLHLLELDADGETLASWGGRDGHEDLGFDWVSGYAPVTDDVMLLTNWLGHVPSSDADHLFAFDRDGDVVWRWGDHDVAFTVTNVAVLDASGF